MKISIVIISYNSARFLAANLESLDKQTVKFAQIIVVDNHSQDESLAILKQYENISIIPLDYNSGYSAAVNIGIKYCDSELIMVANSDIILDENFNFSVIKLFKEENDLALLSPLILRFDKVTVDSAGQDYSRSFNPIEIGYDQPVSKVNLKHKTVFSVCGAATVFHKQALEKLKVGAEYYDEDFFAFWEDFDIGWRSTLYGQKHLFCPHAIVYHYRSGTLKRNYLSRFALSLGRDQEIKYHLVKNRYLTLVKNFRLKKHWWSIPFIICRDFVWVSALTFSAPKIIIKLLKSYSLFKKALEKRRLIKKNE